MRVVARVVAVGILFALGGVVRAGQETVADYQGPAAEAFLTNAKVTASREVGEGITRPLKLTMELDGKTHFAIYKNIDERKFGVQTMADGSSEVNYQDSYMTEIAAYRLNLHARPRHGAGDGRTQGERLRGIRAVVRRVDDARVRAHRKERAAAGHRSLEPAEPQGPALGRAHRRTSIDT